MAQRSAPVVLASRSIQGYNASQELGNVAWNTDGQCLFLRRRGLHIMTPYIHSTLPAPANLADPNDYMEYTARIVNRAKKQAAEMEEAGEDNETTNGDDEKPMAGGGKAKSAKRPIGGEITWWSTTIDISPEADKERDEIYGWMETGDAYSGTITDREAYMRKAIWSPSGVSELGGCVLAVMLSTGQVSIYAPRTDAASKIWAEIADLTVIQQSLVTPRQAMGEPVSDLSMMEMRAVCMDWSKSVPLTHEQGDSNGILAIAYRCGTVALWSCDENRQYHRVQYIDISHDCWVSHLAWSDWTVTSDGVYDVQLALTLADGSIRVMNVRQQLGSPASPSSWNYLVGDVHTIDQGDSRIITSVTWLENILVWTKSKSVHLYNAQLANGFSWVGIRNIKLERVGSWASANALGTCVGIELLGDDGLLLTLSSLTRHLITSIHTEPTLAPLSDSLRLALATRHCFHDYLYQHLYKRDPGRQTGKDDVDMSAVTGGLTSVGEGWGIDVWAVEPLHLHNLNSATEGQRYLNFMVADLSGTLGDTSGLYQRLSALLSAPRKASAQNPLATVLPYILRVLSDKDPQVHGRDLLDMCASHSLQQEVPGYFTASSPGITLRRRLWDDTYLNGLRLRLILALWGSSFFLAHKDDFSAMEKTLNANIKRSVTQAMSQWAAAKPSSPAAPAISTRDSDFLHYLELQNGPGKEVQAIRAALMNASSSHEHSILNDQIDPTLDAEHCPACRQQLTTDSNGTAACAKGHEWVTNLLITTPVYRVCSTCPAISILPKRHMALPFPIDSSGVASDWKRFVQPEGSPKELVEEVLEAATCCLMCGGRWTRSM